MSNIPFKSDNTQTTGFTCSNRETTPQVLEPLDLSTTTEPSKPLQAYRKLYGLHLTVSIGRVMWKCRCSVCMCRYFSQDNKKRFRGQSACCMVIWNIVESISRLSRKLDQGFSVYL